MPKLMPIVRRRITLLLAAVVILIGTLHLAAPPLIRIYALHWLKDHGATHAEIDRVRLNPWLGRLSVEGMTAGDGISIGQVLVDIDWWPLWHHRIYLRALHLERARFRLVQQKDGAWTPVGLRLPPSTPSTPSEHPWQIALHGISLSRVRIALAGRALKAEIPIAQMALTLASMSPAGAQVLNVALKLGAGNIATGGYGATDDAVSLRGQLTLSADAAQPGARHLAIQAQGLRLQDGQMRIGIDRILAHDISAQGNGEVRAGGIEVHGLKASAPDGLSLGSVRHAVLTDLSLGANAHLAFSRLDMQGIGLPATTDRSLGRIADISTTGAELDGDLHLSGVAIRGMDLELLHQKNGLAVIDRLRAMAAPPSNTDTKSGDDAKTDAKKKSPDVRIDHASIDDTSRVILRDAAISPPFVTHLAIESFKLTAFDLQGATPSSLDAAMRLGDEGGLTAKGSFRLHDGLKAADMKIVLRRLSMPPLSGYTEQSFGSAIQTGQMDLDSRVRVHGEAIRAQNRLIMRNLTLKAMPQAAQATQALGMPLGVAVDMLRDDRGDITLDVPISGRLDDPNVHLSDAFNQALTSAMRQAALSSAALLLQPYGSILPAISLATGLLNKAARPRLTPIAFQPRKQALSGQAQAYIAKIATLMKKKRFRLQVCGIAASGDFEAGTSEPKAGTTARNRLLALATSRSSLVIKALVAQGISADRLFSCRPHIDAKAPNGHVELLLQ